jgi:hypothetical protein
MSTETRAALLKALEEARAVYHRALDESRAIGRMQMEACQKVADAYRVYEPLLLEEQRTGAPPPTPEERAQQEQRSRELNEWLARHKVKTA